MKLKRAQAFTLLELLVAVAITLVLAGIMLTVTTGTLNAWRRTQDTFSAHAQAKLVLDIIERDLQSAMHRRDGRNLTWLAADISNTPTERVNHGWRLTARMKPISLLSQRLVPEPTIDLEPAIGEARFGFSSVWLRFIATNLEAGGSLPTAIAYQIVRRPVTTMGALPANAEEIRYSLYRSVVAKDMTLTSGYDVTAAPYASTSTTPSVQRSAATLTNPSTVADVLASNVVDFGVWLHARDARGELRRIFPGNNADLVHRATDAPMPADANRFPDVVDVMVRILTEEGARVVAVMENESGSVSRPPEFATDDAWWWGVVETHSRVFTRRVEIKGAVQ